MLASIDESSYIGSDLNMMEPRSNRPDLERKDGLSISGPDVTGAMSMQRAGAASRLSSALSVQ